MSTATGSPSRSSPSGSWTAGPECRAAGPVVRDGGIVRSEAPTNVPDVAETVTGLEPSAWAERDGAVAGEHRTLVCAHRGASRRLPDNSLRSFEAAIASGCELIETDVRADRRG